jgi:fermentation-respiration switch protein FrsA (DUF1100 family)
MRALIALTLALAFAGCTPAFFQPSGHLYATPGLYGLKYHPVELSAADGTALFAWFLPARGDPRGTVLYLHGNAENISSHFGNIAWMPAEGFNVLALDYRGYGASAGSPSLPGAQLDIDAAMRALLARPDVDPERIIVFGQSLGGALAIHYVAHSAYRRHVRAVIADSPFSDYRLVAREKMAAFFLTWPFQWLPNFTVNNDYAPIASVRALSPIPLLLIHGEDDTIVPSHHSRRLYDGAAQPKDLWLVPETGHIQSLKSSVMRARLTQFLQRHSGQRVAELSGR